MYARALYDKPELHDKIRKLEKGLEPHGLSVSEAAIRWIFHHSILKEGDGVVLGGSKPKYIEENISQIERGPLPPDAVNLLEQI
jgi:aflatoxin B1 aldehyde reductase